MNLSAQKGAIAPLVIIIIMIVGIFVGTKLVDVPQLLKSRAAENLTIAKQSCGGIEGKTCPKGLSCVGMDKYPDAQGYCMPNTSDGGDDKDDRTIDVSLSCDTSGKLSLKWIPVPESTNYTVRINRYPDSWAPDYTSYNTDVLTSTTGEFHGDRAFEAGNVTNTIVNLGYGYFVGGTIISTDGTVQVIPSFTCTADRPVYCPQEITTACAPGNQVYCKSFPTPCDVPADWTAVAGLSANKRCAQVVTRACEKDNPTSCKSFPTPCDVPSGWVAQ